MPMAERAYRVLRDRIVRLDLAPGTVLSEDELIADLGVGRTPVRDAIKRLLRDGLVVVLPRRGTLVADIGVHDPDYIAEARAPIETTAVRLAVERMTDADRSALEELIADLRASDPEDFDAQIDLDARVHGAIYRMTRNPFLEQTLESYYILTTRVWYAMKQRSPVALGPERDRHIVLLEAVIAGAADTAVEQVLLHMDAARIARTG